MRELEIDTKLSTSEVQKEDKENIENFKIGEQPKVNETKEVIEREPKDAEETTLTMVTRSGWDFVKNVMAVNMGLDHPDKPSEPQSESVTDAKIDTANQQPADLEPMEPSEEVKDQLTTTLSPCSVLLPVDFERGVRCWNDTQIWIRFAFTIIIIIIISLYFQILIYSSEKRRDGRVFPRAGKVAPRDFTRTVGPSEIPRSCPASLRYIIWMKQMKLS